MTIIRPTTGAPSPATGDAATLAARHLLSMLGARLTPGGYLLVGPSEATSACPPGLEPVTLGAVRALRRVGRVVSEGRP